MALPRRAVTGGSTAYDWTALHKGQYRQGYAPNSPLSAAGASGLGVAWATDLYGAAVDSPVVYYDAAIGKTLAYIGTERGDLLAVDVATGQILWSIWLGSPIRATPVVASGGVFVGTYDSPRIYKVNATTGRVECSAASPQPIEGTPIAAAPPGGVPTVYFGSNDSATASGPLLAVNAGTCQTEWRFTSYVSRSGTWDPSSYAVDASGVPLVLFGSADPDSQVYAVNAVTGAMVWHFAVDNPAPHVYDVGAGITVSPPGVNGFADGVAYVPSKYGVMYALDLTTGKPIWSFDYNQALKANGGGISTAALAGQDLVLGYGQGLLELDARTGALRWSQQDPAGIEIDSSPAIAGAAGTQVVVAGDLAGGIDVVSLATGQQLYHYQTGGYITASPAVTDGNILIASSDGFLYDLAAGGGNEAALPAATVDWPTDSSVVANPGGNLTVNGAARDGRGVLAVVVAVQSSGPNGLWWDAARRQWAPGPIGNPAALGARGATSTRWRLSFPVPPTGGAYHVTAYAVSAGGQSGIHAAESGFAVRRAPGRPYLTARRAFVAPGAVVDVSGGGFAPGRLVAITLHGHRLAARLASARGTITRVPVQIPAYTPFGQTTLQATERGSRATATAAIVVANSWSQLGYQPGHANFEPNDSTLYNNIAPGDNIFLDLAWLYRTSAAVGASPVVAGGVAFVGNQAGQVTAIDVHNGARLWTSVLPSHAAVDSSLAVDPVRGLLYVAAGDGTLTALSAATGRLLWADHIGGRLFAPVFGRGLLYATSSSGVVRAVAQSTGRTAWSATLPQAITAPPALDPAAGLLVVAAGGRETAIYAGSGRIRWRHRTGGDVTAAPMIAAGQVFLGAGQRLTALRESTGAGLWSYSTGGQITGTPALTRGNLYFGSADGSLYAVRAAGGTLVWRLPFGQPIVGVAACFSVVVFVTSTGVVSASRTWEALKLWQYQTGAAITAAPVIVDGAVYLGASDASLYAFTPYGQQPR
ncbi:MAG: outer membrane protein assembly factor BamB family protein [Streptosporangiaceae bacterium]